MLFTNIENHVILDCVYKCAKKCDTKCATSEKFLNYSITEQADLWDSGIFNIGACTLRQIYPPLVYGGYFLRTNA